MLESVKLGFNKLYLRTETARDYYSKCGWIEKLKTKDKHGLDTTVFESVLVG